MLRKESGQSLHRPRPCPPRIPSRRTWIAEENVSPFGNITAISATILLFRRPCGLSIHVTVPGIKGAEKGRKMKEASINRTGLSPCRAGHEASLPASCQQSRWPNRNCGGWPSSGPRPWLRVRACAARARGKASREPHGFSAGVRGLATLRNEMASRRPIRGRGNPALVFI